MGDIDIDIEVDTKSIERVARALRKGVREGAYESAKWGTRDAKQTAQDQVRTRRTWKGTVLRGFWTNEQRRPEGAWGSVNNPVPHAYIVNYGRKPGGRAPQVQHIIEWVASEVLASIIPDGGGDIGDTDAHPIVSRTERIVDTHQTTDVGIDEPTANIDNMYVVEFENGDRGLFKSYDAERFLTGSVKNEEVFYRITEKMDWNRPRQYPATREWSVTHDDGTTDTGIISVFFEDAADRPLADIVPTEEDPDNPLPVANYVDENARFLAEVGILDYIFNNDDRHYGNTLFHPDGTPIAIDNGFHLGPSTRYDLERQKRLFPMDQLQKPDMQSFRLTNDYPFVIRDPDALEEAAEKVQIEQRAIFERLQADPDLRHEIVDMAEKSQSDQSPIENMFAAMLHPDAESHDLNLFREVEPGKFRWEAEMEGMWNEFIDRLNARRAEEASMTSYDTSSDLMDDILGSSTVEGIWRSAIEDPDGWDP